MSNPSNISVRLAMQPDRTQTVAFLRELIARARAAKMKIERAKPEKAA